MSLSIPKLLPLVFTALCTSSAFAQSLMPGVGTQVVIPASAEVRQENDEAHLTLMIEEQDKDKALAASRVNLKMKQGIETVRGIDPQARLKSRGYFTYPVYPDEPQPKGQRNRQVIAWRVGQFLDVTTTSLALLPKTVAAAQRTLSLNGLNFSLSDSAARRLDDKRIAATYADLLTRIGSIAKTMGRTPADAVLETIDFDGSGAYAPAPEMAMAKMNMRAAAAEPAQIEEPNFEPGETALQMRLVARVRFK